MSCGLPSRRASLTYWLFGRPRLSHGLFNVSLAFTVAADFRPAKATTWCCLRAALTQFLCSHAPVRAGAESSFLIYAQRSPLAEAVYRSFIGFVKFDPRDGTAGDKEVRSFVVRNVGVKDQAIDVRCTLWPSHEDVELAKGDVVLVEGKFTVNKAKDKDGVLQTYFNLSVSNILVLGSAEAGTEKAASATESGVNEPDDEIPY